MLMRRLSVLLLMLAFGVASCVDPPEVKDSPGEDTCPAQLPPAPKGPFHERLLQIAQNYEVFGEMLEPKMRPAPVICDFAPSRIMKGITPADRSMRFSRSNDASSHGKKLYLVFSKYPLYEFGGDQLEAVQPLGQAVVKESWIPEEVPDRGQATKKVKRVLKGNSEQLQTIRKETRIIPYARLDGRLYHASRKYGLFIMFKTDPKTPGTDEGWVYGTVSADGKRVLSAGRLESCMRCHQDAPHDRMFGRPDK